MKKRNVLFGYKYINGKIDVDEKDEIIVKDIFNSYLSGMSLSQISFLLNDQKVEYIPGITGWNKARVMRIIDDKRYLGNDIYPQIIDQITYDKIANLKSSNSTQQDVDRRATIYNLGTPITCKKCGEKMIRRHTRGENKKVIWLCPSKMCYGGTIISDEVLIEKTIKCLNKVIYDPEIIKTEERQMIISKDDKLTLAIETAHMGNRDIVQKMIYDSIAEKYEELNTEYYILKRIKSILKNTVLDSDSLPNVLNKTVKKILLGKKPSVEIMLLNNQIIESEE